MEAHNVRASFDVLNLIPFSQPAKSPVQVLFRNNWMVRARPVWRSVPSRLTPAVVLLQLKTVVADVAGQIEVPNLTG